MSGISLFYIDEKEVDLLYLQNHPDDIEKQIIIQEDGIIDGGLSIGSDGIIGKIISVDLKGNTTNSVTEKMNVKTEQKDKVLTLINEYKILRLSDKINDGDIFCFSDYFILYKIDCGESSYELFDSIDNFEYIINRLRIKKCIYSFEVNKFCLQNMGYTPLNKIDRILMKMHSDKMAKDIHHYYDKIIEYVPFHFNIIGEINTVKNGYSIKPFLVWR